MVKDLDIKYIDLLSEVKSEINDPLSMFERKGQHLNETGYKFVAETIIQEINQIEKKIRIHDVKSYKC
jgi:lysophospholipase L1-like esterase